MTRTKVIVAVSLAFLLLASLGAAGLVAGAASAQTPTGTPTPGAPGAAGSSMNQTFWQSLANQLGVSVDKLQQAFKTAAKDAINQALQQGQITQDQANRENSRIDGLQGNQLGPFGKGFGGFGHEGMGRGWGLESQAVLDAAAKTLGMNTTDLLTELKSGKSLADVAKEKNVDVNTLKQAMIDAAKAEVDQAVKDGKLTQDQATQMKARIDQVAANLDLTKPFSFFGFKGGRHGGRGGWGGQPGQQPATPQAPATTPSSGI